MKKFLSVLLTVTLCILCLSGCGAKKEKVTIFTSLEDYRLEYLNSRLAEEFPNYDITIEYMSTGNHAAKLLAEGKSTECDISLDLEYGYLSKLDEQGILADLSSYDGSIFIEEVIQSSNYLPEIRNGGAIIVNKDVIEEKSLSIPTSYEDLLKPEYKGLIAMPNPKSSGTGYMFLKSLVNEWGEEKAFEYFDKLSENILQFTSSGSGPVNMLQQNEIAIGFGMTAQAVTKLNEGYNFDILYFDEGSPYSLYGLAIIEGKQENTAVREVFNFLINTYEYENCEKFYPEKIFKDKDFVIENFPQNIKYADMSNDTIEEKERLLSKWKY